MLPVLKFELIFEALEPIIPPPAIGAMWRGVLGAALKRRDPALYQACFEASPPPGLEGGLDDAPAPFVLEAVFPPSVAVQPGGRLSLALALFGAAHLAAPDLLAALEEGADRGLGKTRGRAKLISLAPVWRTDLAPEAPPLEAPPHLPEPPPMPEAARVAFVSPLRLRSGGAPLEPGGFSAQIWLDSLSRRIGALAALYAEAPLGYAAPPAPPARIGEVQLWTQKLHRWSASQRREIDMSGLMGSFLLPMRGLEEHWPLIWTAQWTHAGSAATSGLGACRVWPA